METSNEHSCRGSSISENSFVLKTPTSVKRQISKEKSNIEIFKKAIDLTAQLSKKLKNPRDKEKINRECNGYKKQIEEVLTKYEKIDTRLQEQIKEIEYKDEKIEQLQREIDMLKETNTALEAMIHKQDSVQQIDLNKQNNDSRKESQTIEETEILNSTPISKIPKLHSTPIVMLERIPKDVEKRATPISLKQTQYQPKEKRINKETRQLKEMSLTRVLEEYLQINKHTGKEEAKLIDDYTNILKIKIYETIEENEQQKEDIKRIQKTLHDNYKTLTQAANDYQKTIHDLEQELANLKEKEISTDVQKLNQTIKDQDVALKAKDEALNGIGDRQAEAEEKLKEAHERMIEMEEKMQQSREELDRAKGEVENLMKIIQQRDEQINLITNRDESGILHSHIQILNKIQKLEEKIEENKVTKQQQQEITARPEARMEDRRRELYSGAVKHLPKNVNQKVHTIYSKSAILVRRINTSLTLNNLRTILTRETKDKTTVQNVFCGIARDKNTLIIKAETDTETEEILKAIENIETLKEAIEITIKYENTKKIIILGIPQTIDEENIKNQIKQNLGSITTDINTIKTMQRPNAITYQLVLELDDQDAKILIRQGRIKLGFNSCRVLPYLPIIRCGKCQTYGHTEEKCTQKPLCRYCACNHGKRVCYFKNYPEQHKCINCYGSPNYFPHDAASPDCPEFQRQIQARNNFAKINNTNSII